MRKAFGRNDVMNDVSRQSALSYLHALYNGDIDKALTYCDDDIDVIAYASIAIFPDLGHRRGKTAMVASAAACPSA